MSDLVLAHRRRRLADGAIAHRTVLTEAGLTALFRSGWPELRETLQRPDTCFVGAVRDQQGGPWLADEREPYLIESRRNGSYMWQMLYIQPTLPWFTGHFPGRPMTPGVAQIDLAGRLIETNQLASGRFSGLARVKFAAVIAPDTVVKVHLHARDGAVTFSFESARGVCSQGTLRYLNDPDDG